MLSLVLVFLLIHIAIHLINTVGATTIDSLVCTYTLIPHGPPGENRH